MNSTQIPITHEKPNPAAWANIGFAPDSSVLLKHRETGELLRYRMEPKPLYECPSLPLDSFAERQKRARALALADHSTLKAKMRAAAKKRRLSEWADRAGLKLSWCSKFARGLVRHPDPEYLERLQQLAGDYS